MTLRRWDLAGGNASLGTGLCPPASSLCMWLEMVSQFPAPSSCLQLAAMPLWCVAVSNPNNCLPGELSYNSLHKKVIPDGLLTFPHRRDAEVMNPSPGIQWFPTTCFMYPCLNSMWPQRGAGVYRLQGGCSITVATGKPWSLLSKVFLCLAFWQGKSTYIPAVNTIAGSVRKPNKLTDSSEWTCASLCRWDLRKQNFTNISTMAGSYNSSGIITQRIHFCL